MSFILERVNSRVEKAPRGKLQGNLLHARPACSLCTCLLLYLFPLGSLLSQASYLWHLLNLPLVCLDCH